MSELNPPPQRRSANHSSNVLHPYLDRPASTRSTGGSATSPPFPSLNGLASIGSVAQQQFQKRRQEAERAALRQVR